MADATGHNHATSCTTSSDHSRHRAHHFQTAQQQFEAGKLGMWIFLATEILLFGGLFCAYAVYRANHPDIFLYAHQYLDKTLGGINTAVLIFSSLTMAWAVRCAQCGQQRGLVLCLAITLLCGCTFIGIKFVEYEHKWKHHLLPGTHFAPDTHPEHEVPSSEFRVPSSSPASQTKNEEHGNRNAEHGNGNSGPGTLNSEPGTPNSATAAAERSQIPPTALGPSGLAPSVLEDREQHGKGTRPSNVHIFFGIYFAMTGLHGLHVLAGMCVIGWLLVRSLRGQFSGAYFTPVDLAGLYWHLVDLIWIYLFPLLYLIH